MTLQPATQLAQFLVSARSGYLHEPSKYTVILGNEAGDLDSVASSIAYAWFQHVIHKEPTVPLLQINRDDFSLRPENLHALHLAGIHKPQDDLLTLTDVSHFDHFPSHRFILVDHNRLGSAFGSPSSGAEVIAIIDHHDDEGHHTDGTEPRIIRPSGSCASLLVNHFSSLNSEIPDELATLLLTAILIDTSGLKPKGKAVEDDYKAVAYLLPRSLLRDALPSSALTQSTESQRSLEDLHQLQAVQDLSKRLSTLKSDVTSLSTRDLLRRDYKEYTYCAKVADSSPTIKVGLATVPLKLNSWTEPTKIADEIVSFCKERGLTVLGILTTFRGKSGKGKRQMLWIFLQSDSLGNDAFEAVATRLLDGIEASKELDAKVHKSFVMDPKAYPIQWRAYKQRNAKATRKAVAPLVKKLIEG